MYFVNVASRISRVKVAVHGTRYGSENMANAALLKTL
jgi:hypothetical protein